MSNESDNVWGMREYQNRQVFEMDNGFRQKLGLDGKIGRKIGRVGIQVCNVWRLSYIQFIEG